MGPSRHALSRFISSVFSTKFSEVINHQSTLITSSLKEALAMHRWRWYTLLSLISSITSFNRKIQACNGRWHALFGFISQQGNPVIHFLLNDSHFTLLPPRNLGVHLQRDDPHLTLFAQGNPGVYLRRDDAGVRGGPWRWLQAEVCGQALRRDRLRSGLPKEVTMGQKVRRSPSPHAGWWWGLHRHLYLLRHSVSS